MSDFNSKLAKLVCSLTKRGASFYEASLLLDISVQQVKEALAEETGLSLETISQFDEFTFLEDLKALSDLNIPDKTLALFLPQESKYSLIHSYTSNYSELQNEIALEEERHLASIAKPIQLDLHSKMLPYHKMMLRGLERLPIESPINPKATLQYFYGGVIRRNFYHQNVALRLTRIKTGFTTRLAVIIPCRWPLINMCAQLPSGYLVYFEMNMMFSISAYKDFAIENKTLGEIQKLMIQRWEFGVVYYERCIYVIGGRSSTILRNCERYVWDEDRWESITPLPSSCCAMSVVSMKSTDSLYTFGGQFCSFRKPLKYIYRLRVAELCWEVLKYDNRLLIGSFPSFKVSPTATQIFFIDRQKLYSFNTRLNSITMEHTFKRDYKFERAKTTLYHEGLLYCTDISSHIQIFNLVKPQ